MRCSSNTGSLATKSSSRIVSNPPPKARSAGQKKEKTGQRANEQTSTLQRIAVRKAKGKALPMQEQQKSAGQPANWSARTREERRSKTDPLEMQIYTDREPLVRRKTRRAPAVSAMVNVHDRKTVS